MGEGGGNYFACQPYLIVIVQLFLFVLGPLQKDQFFIHSLI